MRVNPVFLIVLAVPCAQAADLCNPADMVGPYAFQLTGLTDISGTPKPTASLGRLVFDGSGNVSGTASATFSGLLLGNPVTGTYEAKADCSVTWQLQDDSGGFQHFSGKLSKDAARVQFRQTDAGGAQRGIMKRVPEACSASDLRKKYDYYVSGRTTPMLPGEVGRSVSAKGTLDVSENGTFQADSDCSVRFVLTLPPREGRPAEPSILNMRGFLVERGGEILAFQTDPGAMVSGRLTSETK